MDVPAFKVPEYILIKVSEPTKGSLATLNAKAEKLSSCLKFHSYLFPQIQL